MLKELVFSSVSSRFILIQDDAKQHGSILLEAFITSFLNRDKNVHLVLFDSQNASTLKEKCEDQKRNAHIYEGYKDPLKWFKGGKTALGQVDYDLGTFLPRIIEGVVIVDSLTPLLLNGSPTVLYQSIFKFLNTCKNAQFISLIHIDVHDEMEIKILENLASTIVRLLPPCRNSSFPFCSILHRKPNGKVVHKTESFTVLLNGELYTEDVEKKIGQQEQTKAPDPTSNLTFNLNLKEDEKEARKELVLPYTRVKYDSQPSGEIHYHLDEADDFDEDDPDDDLNI